MGAFERLVFMILLSSSVFAVDLDSCQNLTTANGIYTLNASVANTTNTCFTASAENITLNCAGFSITGGNLTSTFGVYSDRLNTTIANCSISNFHYGVYYLGTENGSIKNTNFTISHTGGSAIVFTGVNGTKVYDAVISTYFIGINLANGNYLDFKNATINSNHGSGFYSSGVSFSTVNNISSTSSATSFSGFPTYDAIQIISGVNNTVSNSRGNSSLFNGLLLDSSNFTSVSNSSFFSKDSAAVRFGDYGCATPSRRSVSNTFSNVTATGTGAGSTGIISCSSWNTFDNITATVFLTSNSNYGLYLFQSSDSNFTNFTGNGRLYSVLIDSSSNRNKIACGGKKISGVSSLTYGVKNDGEGNSVSYCNISDVLIGSYNSWANGSLLFNNITINQSSGASVYFTSAASGINVTGNSFLGSDNVVNMTSSFNNYFRNNSNSMDFPADTTLRFYSTGSQNTSSQNNRGWWPKLTSDGSDATTQAATAFYNGNHGGNDSDGTFNVSLTYWYGNRNFVLLGAFSPSNASLFNSSTVNISQDLTNYNSSILYYAFYQKNSSSTAYSLVQNNTTSWHQNTSYADANYTWFVQISDNVTTQNSTVRSFYVDTAVPFVNITSPASGSIISGLSVSLGYNTTDNNGMRQCWVEFFYLYSGTVTTNQTLNCSLTSASVTANAYGPYNVTLYGIDAHNKRNSSTILVSTQQEVNSGGSGGGGGGGIISEPPTVTPPAPEEAQNLPPVPFFDSLKNGIDNFLKGKIIGVSNAGISLVGIFLFLSSEDKKGSRAFGLIRLLAIFSAFFIAFYYWGSILG